MQDDWDARRLGPPKGVPVVGRATGGSRLTMVTHRLSLSVLRLSDRITRQRVGSTQQLVLALALVPAQAARTPEMFVPRAGPAQSPRVAPGNRNECKAIDPNWRGGRGEFPRNSSSVVLGHSRNAARGTVAHVAEAAGPAPPDSYPEAAQTQGPLGSTRLGAGLKGVVSRVSFRGRRVGVKRGQHPDPLLCGEGNERRGFC